MASDNRKPELEDAPLSFKSQVWENFGFQVNYHNGERRVDKSKAVCRHCSTAIVYANGNTSNMHKIFAPGTILT
jgi:predicted porin